MRPSYRMWWWWHGMGSRNSRGRGKVPKSATGVPLGGVDDRDRTLRLCLWCGGRAKKYRCTVRRRGVTLKVKGGTTIHWARGAPGRLPGDTWECAFPNGVSFCFRGWEHITCKGLVRSNNAKPRTACPLYHQPALLCPTQPGTCPPPRRKPRDPAGTALPVHSDVCDPTATARQHSGRQTGPIM